MRGTEQRVALVTGATDGLGSATAMALARRGWTVLVHGRDERSCKPVLSRLLSQPGCAARCYTSDFATLAQVANMADAIARREPRLDLLINNAGIGIRAERELSSDGYELVFQVNYLAHYLLTERLLPLLRSSRPAQVINIVSAGQWRIDPENLCEGKWHGAIAYGRSKLAQVAMTLDLAGRFDPEVIAFNCLHPASLMPTKLVQQMPPPRNALAKLLARFLLRPRSTVDDGVQNILRLLDVAQETRCTGAYFKASVAARAQRQAYERDLQRRLRDSSESMCQRAGE